MDCIIHAFFILSARRSYSSNTSCSSGERSSGPGGLVRESDAVASLRSVVIFCEREDWIVSTRWLESFAVCTEGI